MRQHRQRPLSVIERRLSRTVASLATTLGMEPKRVVRIVNRMLVLRRKARRKAHSRLPKAA